MLDKYGGNYSEVSASLEKLSLGNSATLGLRKYRSLYDIIASILRTKEPFTVIWVVRKARLPAKRAEILLSFLKAKNLIAELRPEDLPKPYSQHRRRIFLKITNKGIMFLRKYMELADMIK